MLALVAQGDVAHLVDDDVLTGSVLDPVPGELGDVFLGQRPLFGVGKEWSRK